MSKPLHEMNQAELREYWGNKSSNFLVGKTVRRVRYLTESEREDLGWFRSPLVIEFEDGHWLVPMMMRVTMVDHCGLRVDQT